MNVTAVVEKGENAMVTLSSGTVAWSPDYKAVLPLVGKPIPQGWILKDNKQGTGKVLLPPKQGGGGGYRQSKEAFDREAESRERWQLLEEERKDRRTALMQAAEFVGDPNTGPAYILRIAEHFYDWLRESSPAATASKGEGSDRGRTPPTKADSPTGGPALTSPAGGTTSAQGAAEKSGITGDTTPKTEPGEVKPEREEEPQRATPPSSSSPGSSIYPVEPKHCNHKSQAGRWLPTKTIDGVARCPRCGESALIYRETA